MKRKTKYVIIEFKNDNRNNKTRPCEIKLRKLDLDDIVLSPNSKSSKESPSNNNTLPVNNRQTRTSNRNRIKNPHYYDEEWIT